MLNNNLVLENVYFNLYFSAINFRAVNYQLDEMGISMLKKNSTRGVSRVTILLCKCRFLSYQKDIITFRNLPVINQQILV